MAKKIEQKIVDYEVVKEQQPEQAEECVTAEVKEEDKIVHLHEKLKRPEMLLGSTYKVKTPLSEQLLTNPDAAGALAAQHPLKRLGTPEDAARLAVFLLSPQSTWITGQILSVDGGRSSLQTGR